MNPVNQTDSGAPASVPVVRNAPDALGNALQAVLADQIRRRIDALGEVTIEVAPADWIEVCRALRDDPSLRFEQAVDLCGVDYLEYGEGAWSGPRMAVVLHLLSYEHNWRLRVRTFCPDDSFAMVPTLVDVWPALNWFEREAFDLFGIVFEGHPDLRRILTDYGFVGHPFRKDFPVSGHMEMRYDPTQGRVIYQPVSIAPRNNVPRVVREEGYGVERRPQGGQPAGGR